MRGSGRANTDRSSRQRSTRSSTFPGQLAGSQLCENVLCLDEEDITVQPSSAARYLGVWLDSRLDFTVHCTKMPHRAEACLEALRGIAGSTWGTSLEGLRRVYQAMVVPTMLYCSSVWYNPWRLTASAAAKQTRQRAVMRFTNIQKRAAILISGSFRVVAAEALNIELFLTPIPLLLKQRAEKAEIRIATGPRIGRPRTVVGASPRRRKAYAERTFMEAFAATMGRRGHHSWEPRVSFIRAPWQPRPNTVVETREQALQSHQGMVRQRAILRVYTDGSGFQGHVGAAAVIPKRPSIMTTDLNDYLQRSAYMGVETKQTVYAAELRGLAEGAQLARRVRRPYHTRIIVFTDSQAAFSALRGAGRTSGQAYLIQALEGLERLSQLANLTVEVR